MIHHDFSKVCPPFVLPDMLACVLRHSSQDTSIACCYTNHFCACNQSVAKYSKLSFQAWDRALLESKLKLVCLLAYTGWYRSAPGVLQFLLDKQPPGFPLTPMPLWQLLCDYTQLQQAACVSRLLGMPSAAAAAIAAAGKPPPLPMPILSSMQDILALNEAYMAHFAPHVLREGEAAEPVMPPTSNANMFIFEKTMVETLVNIRYSMLLTLGGQVDSASVVREPLAKQLEEQLWLSPAVADASLAQLGAWCQHHFNQHSNKQQQQPKQGKMGKGGKEKQRNCGSRSKSACNNGSSSSSTKNESSSNSNFAAFNFASASSWSDLQVLPDHEQVAVTGGKLAVAAHLWRVARVHKRMTPVELLKECFVPAVLLRKSLAPELGLQEGEGEPMPGDVRLSSRPAAAATAMQLCLQALVFKGMEVEAAAAAGTGESSRVSNLVHLIGYSQSAALGLDNMLQLLLAQVMAADGATRRAFLSARGGYALQVLWLVLRGAVQHKQQHQRPQQQQQQVEVSEVVEIVPRIMSRICRAADRGMIHVKDGKHRSCR